MNKFKNLGIGFKSADDAYFLMKTINEKHHAFMNFPDGNKKPEILFEFLKENCENNAMNKNISLELIDELNKAIETGIQREILQFKYEIDKIKDKIKDAILSPFVIAENIIKATYDVVENTTKTIGNYIDEIKTKSIEQKYDEYQKTKKDKEQDIEIKEDKNLDKMILSNN